MVNNEGYLPAGSFLYLLALLQVNQVQRAEEIYEINRMSFVQQHQRFLSSETDRQHRPEVPGRAVETTRTQARALCFIHHLFVFRNGPF